MASLSTDRGGLRRILVSLPDGTRPAIRLGRMPIGQARGILGYVKHLEAARRDGSAPDLRTATWLAGCGETLRDRLTDLGLAAPRVLVKRVSVGELAAMFKERPKWRQLAPSTRCNYSKFFAAIEAGLGTSTPIDDVTQAAAENLRGYLLEEKPLGAGLALATASRCVGGASMLFRFAVRSRLLALNPFEGVEQGSMVSPHTAFVDAETSRKVLDALQGTEWRLLFGLSRWGGLRVASEPRKLRWGHIDWERERFTVDSPKTGLRVVPIFSELAPLFDERYAEADDGDELVLPMMAGRCDSTFSSHIAHVVDKLGLTPWSRLWHSMRSTRQTELEERFPSHAVCSWLGNSVDVAHRHYLQTTETHFAKAVEKCAQNPAQHTNDQPRQAETPEGAEL